MAMLPIWEQLQRAYMDGRLRAGKVFDYRGLLDAAGIHYRVELELAQMDLAIHRSPLLIAEVRHGKYEVRDRWALTKAEWA